MNLSKLRKAICLGRLIWVQPPSVGSAIFFTKEVMNSLGILDQEMIYLSARQFIHYSGTGFTPDFFKSTRMLLIGDLDYLPEKTMRELMLHLSRHQRVKHCFDLHLMLISPKCSNLQGRIQRKLNPYIFLMFEENHPIGINEKIHEYIEIASAEYKKTIWSLTIEAARCLESIFIKKGEDYLRLLIFEVVRASASVELDKKSIDAARYSKRFSRCFAGNV